MRFGQLFQRIGMAIGLSLLIGGGAIAVLLGTSPGRNFVAQIASGTLSNSSQQIEIIGLDSVFGTLAIKSVVLKDDDGEFARIDGINVKYAPSGLLGGKIEVESATIDNATLIRPPQGQQAVGGNTRGFPSILLPAPFSTLNLRQVNVLNIEVPASIAGDDRVYALSGAAQIESSPSLILGDLRIVENGGSSGSLDAKWQFVPSQDRLEIDARLSEDSDGFIAQLINIPTSPAIKLNVKGGGPLSDWKSQLSVYFDDRLVTSGAVTLAIKDAEQTISAQLTGQLAPLLPKAFLPLVAGNTEFSLKASRNDAGDVTINQAQLISGLASARVTGGYQPSIGLVDLAASAQIGVEGQTISFSRQEGTATELGMTTLSAVLKGPIADAALNVSGDIAYFEERDLRFADLQFVALSNRLDLAAGRGTVTFEALVTEVSTGQTDLDAVLSGDVRLRGSIEGDGRSFTLAQTSLASNGLNAVASGTFDTSAARGKLTLQGTLDDVGDSLIGRTFGRGQSRFALDGEIIAPDKLTLTSATFGSENLNARFAGSLDGASIDLDGEVQLNALSALSKDVTGQLQALIKIDGPLANPRLDLSAQGIDLALSGKMLRDAKVEITGSPLDALLLSASAEYEAAPITANALYRAHADGGGSISDIRIQAPGLESAGALTFAPEGSLQGKLTIDASDFAAFGALLLQPNLSGSATGKILLTNRNQLQTVQIELTSPSFSSGDVKIENARLSAEIGDLFGKATPNAQINADEIALAGERIIDAEAQVSSIDDVWPVRLGGRFDGRPFEIVATAKQNNSAISIALEKAALSYKGLAVILKDRASLELANGTAKIEGLRLGMAEGTVSISGTAGETLNIDAQIERVSVSAIDAIAKSGQGLSGAISGRAKITGSVNAPRVGFSLNGQSLSVARLRDAGLSSLGLSGDGTFSDNRLNGEFNIAGGGLSLAVTGGVNLGTNSVSLKASGDAPFDYFAQILTRSGVVLTGSARLDASVSGPLDAPQFSGALTTQNARLTEIASRIRVTDILATIRLEGEQATLVNLNGRTGRNGEVSASGAVSLRPSDKLATSLNLNIRNGEYDDGNIIAATFDANLALSGRLAETGVLSGQVNLSRTDITVPATLANTVSPVAVTHKNASAEVNAQASSLQVRAGNTGPAMGLDIAVNAPNQIFVRGRGLDAEFGGSFSIRGTTALPIAAGSLNLIRGRMEILTKRFDFDFGRLIFAGPLIPTLDFAATTRDNGSTYTIFVKGEATSPGFSFGASPSLPQDQIVAKLFFGRNLAELSPLQLAQLANAIAELNGTNSGPGLLDRLRSIAGLDDVDIKTNEQGETTVGVGAYLNDRTYVNVEKGAGAGSGKVTIDLNITDNITARGETSEDGSTKAGVFYQKDY